MHYISRLWVMMRFLLNASRILALCKKQQKISWNCSVDVIICETGNKIFFPQAPTIGKHILWLGFLFKYSWSKWTVVFTFSPCKDLCRCPVSHFNIPDRDKLAVILEAIVSSSDLIDPSKPSLLWKYASGSDYPDTLPSSKLISVSWK